MVLLTDGEIDIRGCYCAMATAHMLGLDAPALACEASMVDFVRSCQVGRLLAARSLSHLPEHHTLFILQTCCSNNCKCIMCASQQSEAEACRSVHCAEQTYEGGIGGEPGNEAHGGYTFCGLAAAALAGVAQALDLGSLARWAASCQVLSKPPEAACSTCMPTS
jgi:prenyltransferase beta subunit